MFKFKGLSSSEMGVVATEEDLLQRASQRYIKTKIEGRDGALFETVGYDNVDIRLDLNVLGNNLDDILSWLNGTGYLEYNGRKVLARCYDTVQMKRLSGIQSITASFIRNPFWIDVDESYKPVSTSITNPGNANAKPLLKLVGKINADIDVTIGSIRFQYHFDQDNEVIIDCDEKKETYQGLSKSRNITIGFAYPELLPGANVITIHKGDVTIQASRVSAWL